VVGGVGVGGGGGGGGGWGGQAFDFQPASKDSGRKEQKRKDDPVLIHYARWGRPCQYSRGNRAPRGGWTERKRLKIKNSPHMVGHQNGHAEGIAGLVSQKRSKPVLRGARNSGQGRKS